MTIKNKNYQTGVYNENRGVKEHEKRMLEIINEIFQKRAIRVLDIGCADGKFLNEILQVNKKSSCYGIDLSKDLVERENLKYPKVKLSQGDASKILTQYNFDLIVASGILSVFEEPEPILKHWISFLKREGSLILFNRFNSENIDTIINFRVDKNVGWEGGWTSFSIKSIKEILYKCGYTCDFRKFVFSGLIKKTGNPVKTYTFVGENGDKLLLSGGNVVAEQFFCIVKKK
tara:strand:+ start:352 stop:1044 length:693 start_codon:yes stop_codon:yes gene_type:complete